MTQTEALQQSIKTKWDTGVFIYTKADNGDIVLYNTSTKKAAPYSNGDIPVVSDPVTPLPIEPTTDPWFPYRVPPAIVEQINKEQLAGIAANSDSNTETGTDQPANTTENKEGISTKKMIIYVSLSVLALIIGILLIKKYKK